MSCYLSQTTPITLITVTISDNLDWSKHITTTTTKANARLSFIKRNLKDCPQKLKEIAYFSLVRSFVDYASAVWDPHQKFNQVKLEMVQRRAARFVKNRYRRTDSVTAMLDELAWPILSKRRKDARLILFYKIINNLAQVPHEHKLTKAYEGTRKKKHKFRHIAMNTSQYRYALPFENMTCQIIRSSYLKLQRKVSYIQNTFPFCSKASSSKVTAILVSRITAFFGH